MLKHTLVILTGLLIGYQSAAMADSEMFRGQSCSQCYNEQHPFDGEYVYYDENYYSKEARRKREQDWDDDDYPSLYPGTWIDHWHQ